ncbi:hypothetical protein [Nocardiopsis sp. CNR-923]|uniref:hypothetical protein n=1 Tax=Nocardiopsis sp. CNR-923 TaxID=1904965 RepID=UPI001300E6A9|nr:hypothetical protein [Nocardiopsis sp. CNR-923]
MTVLGPDEDFELVAEVTVRPALRLGAVRPRRSTRRRAGRPTAVPPVAGRVS